MVFSPLYLVVMNWVFPFEISLLSDWILLWIWEHLIYVLQLNTRGDNGVSYWFTWYMFWHSTRGFPRWHWGNLCIGVDARSYLCFSSRNLGALFEVLCVGLNIMNLRLCDAYRIIDPRILVVTLEYLGDIRIWLMCVMWCYFTTNSRVVCDTYRNSPIHRSERIALRCFRTLQ